MLTVEFRLALAVSFKKKKSAKVLVVEQKNERTQFGRADGLKFTTLEVFDQMGIKDAIMAEAYIPQEVCNWDFLPGSPGGIVRTRMVPDIIPGLDKSREAVLGQGRIEHHLLKRIAKNPNVTVL